MALTRQQELFLMQLGIQYLHAGIPTQKETKQVEKRQSKSRPKPESKSHWMQTTAGRKRMSEIMHKRWQEKRKNTK